MIRHSFVAAAVALVLVLTPLPAHAAPDLVLPLNMTIWDYFDSGAKTNLIDQRWSGCGTSGGWGSTSSYVTIHKEPC